MSGRMSRQRSIAGPPVPMMSSSSVASVGEIPSGTGFSVTWIALFPEKTGTRQLGGRGLLIFYKLGRLAGGHTPIMVRPAGLFHPDLRLPSCRWDSSGQAPIPNASAFW
jgi:hypothetical protein